MKLAIYVHIPYCVKKCPYCDFNSYGVGNRVPEEKYTEALINELSLYQNLINKFDISSVFFGGGTPSLFTPKNIGKIISSISSITNFCTNTEITVEVNPKTAEINKFNTYEDIGVNRLSLGVQSFSSRKLRFLGRLSSPADNIRCIEEVLDSGIDNFNVDLMYGTTGETFNEWEHDLLNATDFKPNHISAYCLTIESGTEFKKKFERGDLILPDENTLTDMIDFTSEYLGQKEYNQYEISNYSLKDYECLHNKFYWQGLNYLGLGAGAHSHIKSYDGSKWGERWSNVRYPNRYMSLINSNIAPVDKSETLTRLQAFEDDLMMGLRLMKGLDLDSLYKKYKVDLNLRSSDYLFAEGLMSMSHNTIKLSRKGILVSDYIISRLLDQAATGTW
jgi:oxygen-independent coproporphyrinogen-3 oxidase